ncbi:hypothetical protein [Ruegeria jejuensis]|uniref:hypothetical protein n=1 Tax=Ruegeria jejuensis TaxID=3233338 RepID=UPI00355BA98E
MIRFTRAVAASEISLSVSATLDTAEPYEPSARLYQYEHQGHDPSGEWFYENFRMSVQDILFARDIGNDVRPSYYTILSADGEVQHLARPAQYLEIIPGTGAAEDNKNIGCTYTLRQIGDHLYVVGAGGQFYKRYSRDGWALLSETLLFDPKAERRRTAEEEAKGNSEPEFGTEEWIEWSIADSLRPPASRNILFNDIAGLTEDAIYLCGEVGPGSKPVLAYWNGGTLEELKVPMEEAALTGIYIESPDEVWICGREGVLLHGSHARGFNPVPGNRRLNLFHHITPYRGKLVMPASVRPGGLWEYDPNTGMFGHFEPRLPPLTKSPADRNEPDGGPFFAQAVGDVLWVVASRDIFRFDGNGWERIKHPDRP